ncbi:MAG: TetR family transcriptional regulator [Actinomycetota bacterium]|nr:TetR family transcriptional regulator [Actinomycetota bacterium]
MSRRTGRRPGGEGDAQAAILAAARTTFAEHGYDATTMRGIARAAEVDPALVAHYFGSKDRLFGAAMELTVDPAAMVERVVAGPRSEIGRRLVEGFLEIWEDEAARGPLLVLVRSALTHERAAASLRAFVTDAIVGRIAAHLEVDDPLLRATLVGSHLVGLAMLRYVLRFEPLASADRSVLCEWIAPTVQHYLTGPAPTG